MTPSLFAGTDATDEYSFLQTAGALKKLRYHQKNFITEEDFKWLSEHDINAVRIPIGYWILDGDAPFKASIGKLDWAVQMGAKYNINVLICLHGAPGSQNGLDHSGRQGKARWYDDEQHRKQTVNVLKCLAARYHDQPALWGIELLNEPIMKLLQPTLRKFYKQAYHEITTVARPGLAVVIHDAFLPALMSGVLWPYANYPVYLDHHWYHFFVPAWLQKRLSFKWYYRYLHLKARALKRLERTQPVIIGEWNGIIGGQKLSQYPQKRHDEIVSRHINAQRVAFSGLYGQFYWSYKTEDRGVYHYRSMVEDGFFT